MMGVSCLRFVVCVHPAFIILQVCGGNGSSRWLLIYRNNLLLHTTHAISKPPTIARKTGTNSSTRLLSLRLPNTFRRQCRQDDLRNLLPHLLQ